MAARREPEGGATMRREGESVVSSRQASVPDGSLPCTWQPLSNCHGCEAEGKLMCRWEKKDFLQFFLILIVLPFAATAIAGTLHAGYGWYLLPWLTYSLFFFFVWEAWVLCRHCPFWVEPGKVIRCHANYGVIKIWRYQPRPMSRSEKIQFVIGALLWIAFPMPFMLLGQAYLWVLVTAVAALGGTLVLKRSVCTRCVNFSCPMNTVPKPLVNAYLRRNPEIQAAWETGKNQPSVIE